MIITASSILSLAKSWNIFNSLWWVRCTYRTSRKTIYSIISTLRLPGMLVFPTVLYCNPFNFRFRQIVASKMLICFDKFHALVLAFQSWVMYHFHTYNYSAIDVSSTLSFRLLLSTLSHDTTIVIGDIHLYPKTILIRLNYTCWVESRDMWGRIRNHLETCSWKIPPICRCWSQTIPLAILQVFSVLPWSMCLFQRYYFLLHHNFRPYGPLYFPSTPFNDFSSSRKCRLGF